METLLSASCQQSGEPKKASWETETSSAGSPMARHNTE